MEKYLIDNNVISSYFSGDYSQTAMDFVAGILDQIPNISVITQIEALSWRSGDVKKEAIVKDFIEDANKLPLSPDVVLSCVEIRRNKKIKTPDAVIAATAIVGNYILITNDTDFNNIQGLRVLNPSTL